MIELILLLSALHSTLQIAWWRNLEQKKGLWDSFCSDRLTCHPAEQNLFSLSSQSNPSFLAQLKPFICTVTSHLGLASQFVSPLITKIHYPALHIKTHTGSSQTRELSRWTLGKKHNHLYKQCYSRASLLFLLSRRRRFLPLQTLQKQGL